MPSIFLKIFCECKRPVDNFVPSWICIERQVNQL